MRLLRWTAPALAVLLASGLGDAAPAAAPAKAHRQAKVQRQPHTVDDSRVEAVQPAIARAWAVTLPAVEVKNRNTDAHAKIRLYSNDGAIDRAALDTFMRVACSDPDAPKSAITEPLAPRVVQLAFRAAHHFDAPAITLVSATRRGAHGKHGSGDAIDIQLEGVSPAALAAFVRTYPRAGIGIYTHPKTQYVHLDVRDHSYHWSDASPPGVTWPEQLLADPTQATRDAAYAPALDLPERALK